MKTLYKINIALVIINVLMVITNIIIIFIDFFKALVCFAIIGIYQLLLYVFYLILWKRISKTLRIPFIIYGVLIITTGLLFWIGTRSEFVLTNLLMYSMSLSVFIAFYFLLLSITQGILFNSRLKNNKSHN